MGNKVKVNRFDELYKTDLFRNNEVEANKSMALGCLIFAVIISIFLPLVATGVIPIHVQGPTIYIDFAVDIVLLVSVFVLSKTKLVKSSNFKYYILLVVTFAVCALNIMMPKQSTLAWALMMALATSYHSPKIGTITLITSQIMMLGCTYFAVFVGEWDNNLFTMAEPAAALSIGLDGIDGVTTFLTPEQRIQFMNSLEPNRWLQIAFFFYLPRAATLAILCVIAYAITFSNRRLLMTASNDARTTEKMSTELNVAADIQISALPSEFPHNDHFDLYASMHAAKAVGGDFYDFFSVGDKYFAFLIADVSGKGVPAAMFMMKAKTLIKTLALSGHSPAEALTLANRELCNGNDQDMFVTCFFAGINFTTGKVAYVNAGHNPPLVKHKGGTFQYLGGKPQFILGGLDSFVFKEETATLLPGDEVLLYTDGVTEALSDKNTFFGEPALLDTVNSCGVHNGKLMIEHVQNELDKFANGAEQADDITMLLFRFFGETRREITVPATSESTQKILDFVEQYLESHDADMKTIAQINIVIDELYSNIAKFAYKDYEGDGNVTIVLDMINDQDFNIIFTDNGKPFNPLERDDPDINLSAEDRDIGGLGIFIVRKTMDNVTYAYKDNLNILSLTKKIK